MRRGRLPLTLGHLLALCLLAMALCLGGLYGLLYQVSRESIMDTARQILAHSTLEVDEEVRRYVRLAEGRINDFQTELEHGLFQITAPDQLETVLYRQVLDHPDLAELTFIYVHPQGPLVEVSVARSLGAEGTIMTRQVRAGPEGFRVWRREGRSGPFQETADPVDDPRSQPTFTVPLSAEQRGLPVWSDLHWAELDQPLAMKDRRVVVTVQKAVPGGVLRVGTLTQQIDGAASNSGGQYVFLCDLQGRLVTRVSPEDQVVEMDGDLRVKPTRLPPELAAALDRVGRAGLSQANPYRSTALEVGGVAYLLGLRRLDHSQDWAVGNLVPEALYTGPLVQQRNRFLLGALAFMAGLLALMGLAARGLSADLALVLRETDAMAAFRFERANLRPTFLDVERVVQSLEQAKTALRSLSLYVPVSLVRELFAQDKEPSLGGELREVSLMFTDIADFTTLAEGVSPDQLAVRLGRYLEAMTAAVHRSQGMVDKYIGDSVMAVWNAPGPVERHSIQACRAALDCLETIRRLFADPSWEGPPLPTRFGLHRDQVLVGNLGAPDRMNYTVLGDGVNLASRLEGLNKQYGTSILASQSIVDQTGEEFDFRVVDLVAVKGKTRGVRVYELLGPRGQAEMGPARVYEQAFEAYLRQEFQAAIELLARLSGDPPSRVLEERCRQLLEDPPRPNWSGVFRTKRK